MNNIPLSDCFPNLLKFDPTESFINNQIPIQLGLVVKPGPSALDLWDEEGICNSSDFTITSFYYENDFQTYLNAETIINGKKEQYTIDVSALSVNQVASDIPSSQRKWISTYGPIRVGRAVYLIKRSAHYDEYKNDVLTVLGFGQHKLNDHNDSSKTNITNKWSETNDFYVLVAVNFDPEKAKEYLLTQQEMESGNGNLIETLSKSHTLLTVTLSEISSFRTFDPKKEWSRERKENSFVCISRLPIGLQVRGRGLSKAVPCSDLLQALVVRNRLIKETKLKPLGFECDSKGPFNGLNDSRQLSYRKLNTFNLASKSFKNESDEAAKSFYDDWSEHYNNIATLYNERRWHTLLGMLEAEVEFIKPLITDLNFDRELWYECYLCYVENRGLNPDFLS